MEPREANSTSTTPFAKYFKLKDEKRSNFRLNPNEDASLYIDLDGVLNQIRKELEDEAPRFVIQGDFGSGKSHILHYVEHVLGPPRFRPIYLLLSGFNRRSDFYMVHRAIMNVLLPIAKQVLQLPASRRPELNNIIRPLGPDMQRALKGLQYIELGKPHGDGVAAEQWLGDSRLLSSARATKAGYGGTLREKATPNDLVALYKSISDLHFAAFSKKIILLVDEGESFTRVVDVDAQASIGAGLRGLFDPENRSLGFLFGLNTPSVRVGTHPMLRSDVRSRVGHRIKELQPLNTPPRIVKFLEELWEKLGNDNKESPFYLDNRAIELITTRLNDLRKQVYTEQRLSPSPTPRDLLEILSKIGQAAAEANTEKPISADIIKLWFGLGA